MIDLPPQPTIKVENPAFTAWVERRAIDLCTNATPEHTDARPCFSHLQMARREGFAAWRTFPDLGDAVSQL